MNSRATLWLLLFDVAIIVILVAIIFTAMFGAIERIWYP